MNINEIATKQDLEKAKNDILNVLSSFKEQKTHEKVLRSRDVKKMLGISTGTLQNLRITGKLIYTKLGGSIFYRYEDVIALLKGNEVGKKHTTKN